MEEIKQRKECLKQRQRERQGSSITSGRDLGKGSEDQREDEELNFIMTQAWSRAEEIKKEKKEIRERTEQRNRSTSRSSVELARSLENSAIKGVNEHVFDDMGNKIVVEEDIVIHWDEVDKIKRDKTLLRSRFFPQSKSNSPKKPTHHSLIEHTEGFHSPQKQPISLKLIKQERWEAE